MDNKLDEQFLIMKYFIDDNKKYQQSYDDKMNKY